MNTARAYQVLSDIANTVATIESECERLCILINECRTNEYWRLQYNSELQWGLAVFGSTSSFRHLAAMGSAYKDNPRLITELGRSKAETLIPVMRNEGKLSEGWHRDAKRLTADKLAYQVRNVYPSRRDPKTERGILVHDIQALKNRIAFYEREIVRLKERLASKEKQLEMVEKGAA
jgi:hypothetical protein